MRAVAERAGVNERTVYRHFANERGLRDAVMHRMEEQAGIDLTTLRLEDIADVAGRIFASVSTHPLPPRPPLDPTLTEASQRQREALLRALAPHTEGGPRRTGRWPRRCSTCSGAWRPTSAWSPTGGSTPTRPSPGSPG